jgi:hypothetical protein
VRLDLPLHHLASLQKSYLVLNEKLYKEIQTNVIPSDTRPQLLHDGTDDADIAWGVFQVEPRQFSVHAL